MEEEGERRWRIEMRMERIKGRKRIKRKRKKGERQRRIERGREEG